MTWLKGNSYGKRQISVKNIKHIHDCAGRKFIYITSMEDDELIPTHFRLTRNYMLPDTKLSLATVAPMDDVVISIGTLAHDLSVSGEYIDNLSYVGLRVPACGCGTVCVSDGFDIYCPNPQCPLTVAARLERLANTVFFSPDQIFQASHFEDDFGYPDHDGLMFTGDAGYTKPFFPIATAAFWGSEESSLADVLMTRHDLGHLSVATFLIEPLFLEFIEKVKPYTGHDDILVSHVLRLYRELETTTNRRDYGSLFQNHLVASFIWSLGIETLTQDNITALVAYEQGVGHSSDTFLVYASAVTRPPILVNEIGLHMTKAEDVLNEVRRRGDEFYDIFRHYSFNLDDVNQFFNRILR